MEIYRNELGRHPGGRKGGKRKTRRLCYPRSGPLERNPEMEIQDLSGITSLRKWGQEGWAEGEIPMWCYSSLSLSRPTESSGAGMEHRVVPDWGEGPELCTLPSAHRWDPPVLGYGLSLGRGLSLGKAVCLSESNSQRWTEPRAINHQHTWQLEEWVAWPSQGLLRGSLEHLYTVSSNPRGENILRKERWTVWNISERWHRGG